MFSQAKKYLEESAKSATSGADQLISHTNWVMNNVKVYENCYKCNAQVSVLGNLLTSQNTCRMCAKLFCNACIAKTSIEVPHHLLDITYQGKNAPVAPDKQYLCKHQCTPKFIAHSMQRFRKDINKRFQEFVDTFLQNELMQQFFFVIPRNSPEDTAYRKAIRFVHVAGTMCSLPSLTYYITHKNDSCFCCRYVQGCSLIFLDFP
jgi:hypothetical protein